MGDALAFIVEPLRAQAACTLSASRAAASRVETAARVGAP